MHINKINNKIYVGQTNNIKRRWRANGIEYTSQETSIIGKAILKYGWENFEHIIIEENLTLDEANALEAFLINELEAQNREKGYNIREGGKNGGLSEATKQKLSETAKAKGLWKGELNPRHITPLYGEKNGMYGKHHTEKTKALISFKLKGKSNHTEESKAKISKFMSTQHPRAKKVRCIETGEIFNSARQAAKAKGLGNSTVSRICNGERKPGKGKLNWEWYYEEKE